MQLIENASKKEVLMMSFEEKMKKELKKNLEIPDVVEQKIQDAYKEIGQGNVTMKKLNNGNQKKKRLQHLREQQQSMKTFWSC